MKLKKRLFASFSISNIINNLAILNTLPQENWENHFVYLGQNKNFEIWNSFLRSNSFIKNIHNLSKENIIFGISEEELIEKVNIKNFDELYLQFNGADYRTITRLYKNAKIYLVEDGLSSHEKHELTFLFHKKPSGLYIHEYLKGFTPHETRYSNLKYIKINPEMTTLIYKNIAKDIECPYNENTVVLCAQEIFSTEIISYKKEFEMYANAVDVLLKKGYKVIFKEHPRNIQPFFPVLKKIFNTELFYEFPKTDLPVEAFIAKKRPKAIVSAFSTSMFLASYLFDCPTYSLDFLKYKTQNLVLRHYDFASVIAQTIFKDVAFVEIDYKKIYDKQIDTLLKIKELEFYRMFISRKEFYLLKKNFLTYCKNVKIIKSFHIHPVVINIIKNGKYIDLLKCNKLNIVHNSKLYFKEFKNIKTLAELIFVLNQGFKNVLKSVI